MTQDEIIEMAQEVGLHLVGVEEFWAYTEVIEAFAKLVEARASAKERENIKHSLVASSVSVQSRVYIGEEVISNLRMTHEEIQARGEEC